VKKHYFGYTLVEMIVVVVIVFIVASIVIPSLVDARKNDLEEGTSVTTLMKEVGTIVNRHGNKYEVRIRKESGDYVTVTFFRNEISPCTEKP
jgi:Tfp pilus assembly protein PilE